MSLLIIMVSSQVKNSRIFISGFDHSIKNTASATNKNENIGITIMNVVGHIGTMYVTHLSVQQRVNSR